MCERFELTRVRQNSQGQAWRPWWRRVRGREEVGYADQDHVDRPWASPVILCDVCGAWIERADDGAYAWNEERPESGTPHEMAFVHKENCLLAYEAEHSSSMRDMPLDVFLPYLAASLSVDWRAATTMAQYFSTP